MNLTVTALRRPLTVIVIVDGALRPGMFATVTIREGSKVWRL
jgi:hypothetical protein